MKIKSRVFCNFFDRTDNSYDHCHVFHVTSFFKPLYLVISSFLRFIFTFFRNYDLLRYLDTHLSTNLIPNILVRLTFVCSRLSSVAQ